MASSPGGDAMASPSNSNMMGSFTEDDLSPIAEDFQEKKEDPYEKKKREEAAQRERYLKALFDNFGLVPPDNGVVVGDCGIKYVEPVAKLAKERFRLSTTDVGAVLQLKMVKQRPYQQIDSKPLFELEEFSQAYEDMEKKMITTYDSFSYDPMTPQSKIVHGVYYALEQSDNRGNPFFKRVKVVKPPKKFSDGTVLIVEVELVDEYFKKNVSPDSILWLDESFAKLAPRVTAIEMEGMSYYKENEMFRRFVRFDSDEYLFDGVLQAEVQASGKVLIWSDRFPKEKYPYGINGYITRSLIDMMWPEVVGLPPAGHFKDDVFVVHADHEGFISLQFKNDLTNHLMELCGWVTHEQLVSMGGSVKPPFNVKNIYFAPHERSGGTYYRAVMKKKEKSSHFDIVGGKIRVRFIDYGDEDFVKLEDLVRVEEVHYLLAHFPPICVPAHLENIWNLDQVEYINQYHASDIEYRAHTIVEAKGEKPAEVSLYLSKHKDMVCVNEEIVKSGIAAPIDPYYNYQGRDEKIVKSLNWSIIPKLYLGLGRGQRLHVGDELKAQITYTEGMEGYMFLTPTHRLNTVEDLETKLRKQGEHLCNKGKVVSPPDLKAGECFICPSRVEREHCRGVLISEVIDKKHKPKGNPKEAYWVTYLLDHGFYEVIPVSEMSYIKPEHVNLPALGIRAIHKKLLDEDAMKRFWIAAVKWFKGTPFEVIMTVKINAMGKDECGEIVEVDSPLMEAIIEQIDWDVNLTEDETDEPPPISSAVKSTSTRAGANMSIGDEPENLAPEKLSDETIDNWSFDEIANYILDKTDEYFNRDVLSKQ